VSPAIVATKTWHGKTGDEKSDLDAPGIDVEGPGGAL
jgi:hypothetical protein